MDVSVAPTTHDPDSPYLNGLNPPQAEAVLQTDGPLLILAGAGTGKTRVLTTRLGHILGKGLAYPSQILAVTFTNKAAQEMKDRISHLLGGAPVEGWWLGTFHALAARMLRRHAEKVGLKQNFTILDTDDQLRLIKQIIEAEGINAKDWPPRTLLGIIERWKDKALAPENLERNAAGDVANGRLVEIYKIYQDRLRTLNACDFGDLLMHVIQILRNPEHANVVQQYREQFRYILVDEYQDTNNAQYMWLKLLTAPEKPNICCVGDDDQSIYGWRGAEIGNILRFERDFPGAKIVRLEQNYRSTGHILAAAAGLIARNQGRHEKTLWTQDELGEKPIIKHLWDGEQEARFVGEEIEAFQHKGTTLNEMAVLVRASSQMREFEERFINLGIPYRVVGGPRFYERMEIRDAMAYFRATFQPADDLAFERIINTPVRGIGPALLKTLHSYARAADIPLTESVLQLLETDELKPKQRDTLRGLMTDFARWRQQLDELPHTEVAKTILDESGYTGHWMKDKSPEADGRLENLKELVSAMAEFPSMAAFLEHVSLVMDNQENRHDDMVSLMTLHAAKGLEFDIVFLPGWEEGIFPNQRALDESGLTALEEERRLAYVGITRAKRRAFIMHVNSRRLYGGRIDCVPSRFLSELPDEHVERSSAVQVQTRTMNPYSHGGFSHYAAPNHRNTGRVIDMTQTATASLGHDKMQPGKRVFHEKFGYGTILRKEMDKLDIHFEKSGRKKVMEAFVKPADEV